MGEGRVIDEFYYSSAEWNDLSRPPNRLGSHSDSLPTSPGRTVTDFPTFSGGGITAAGERASEMDCEEKSKWWIGVREEEMQGY